MSRRRKGRSKSDIAFLPSIFFAIISTHLLLCRRNLLELNSLETYPSSEGNRNPRRGLFTSSIKREMRHFHVIFVHWRQSNLHLKKVWCTCKVVVLLIKPIDRFQSRGQQLEWMNEWMIYLMSKTSKVHSLPSQRLMLKTLDKLQNTEQDKMWIICIQILRKTLKHGNFGKMF